MSNLDRFAQGLPDPQEKEVRNIRECTFCHDPIDLDCESGYIVPDSLVGEVEYAHTTCFTSFAADYFNATKF